MLAVILGLAFTAAPNYLSTGDCEFSVAYLVASLFLAIFLLVAGACAARGVRRLLGLRLPQVLNPMAWAYGRAHPVCVMALVILLCWSPILFMLLPGTCCNDTWGQLGQVLGVRELSDHHPLFDTFLIAGSITLVHGATGSWHLGMALYVLCQAVATSFAFARTLDFARSRLGLPDVVTSVFLAAYAFVPYFAINAQEISKDALFSWVFIFFLVEYFDVILTRGESLGRPRRLLCLGVTAVLCCLTKKLGMFIVVPSLLILIPFSRVNRRRLALLLAVPLAVMLVVMPVVRSGLGAAEGGRQEMFSLLYQQTARVVVMHGDEIPDDEREAIDAMLGYDDLAQRYSPTNADGVKAGAVGADDSAYGPYLRTWLRQALRYPDTYLDATNAMLAGWFSLSEYKPLMNMSWHSQILSSGGPSLTEDVAVRPGVFSRTAAFAEELYDRVADIPVLDVFFSYGLYASLLPAWLLVMSWGRRARAGAPCALALAPLVISVVLGCWLAPVSAHLEGTRYLLPIVCSTPLLVMWTMWGMREGAACVRRPSPAARISLRLLLFG